MENYRGVLVCCTNLLGNLDRAALRRFSWKLKFRYINGGGIEPERVLEALEEEVRYRDGEPREKIGFAG
jgi:hypothetical protein